MQIINSIGQPLFMAFSMFWEILWPLILGFTLSSIIQALVSRMMNRPVHEMSQVFIAFSRQLW